MSGMDVPVVDFKNCSILNDDVAEEEQERVGKEIYDAFSTIGFVYLENTGVSEELVEEAKKVARQFFALPPGVKKRYAYDQNYTGYHEMYKEGTNPNRPKDIKEAYNVGGMALSSGSINWPNSEVGGFSEAMTEFYGLCRKLAMRILDILSIGMKMKDKNYLARSHSRIGGERNYTILRSLHYPPLPEESELEPGQIRLGEHSDYGTLTLLFQDDIGGLEIEMKDGEYVELKPIPGTVLVNIGDLLQFWTKGKLKSTRHRITNPTDPDKRRRSRYSMVCFVHPDYEVKLSEIEYEAAYPLDMENQKPVECNLENCVTAVEYVETKLRNTY